ncbi:MAG: L,D-transpeptidase family protein [Chitinophagaceae bacterium]|nr:L,D-transpeptidase family protein [Chitinophagaceae bacterium]
MRYLFIAGLLLLGVFQGICQSQTSANSFIDYQRSFPRISDALKRKQDTLIKQFEEKKLPWPAKYIYLRSFKYDSQLEVWVKYDQNEKFRLFKTYKVCALSGSLGPKRMQGDYQVPEGFYYVNEFNPKSIYHLSLGLNYPNASDRLLADSIQPGGDIYIHGSCVTTGCIPITNGQIEELYILATHARNAGQDFIPVHIFPVQFKNQRSVDYLTRFLKDFPEYTSLSAQMKLAYQYFDKTKELPIVMISKKGNYVVEADLPVEPPKTVKVVKKREPKPQRFFAEEEIAKVVDKLPEFPGGKDQFQAFLDKVSRDMIDYLNEDQPKAYVMVEFIIDKEGKPANARVIKGGNDELNEKLEERFDKMPLWSPAIRTEKPVAIRLKQSIFIEKALTVSSASTSANDR